MFFFSGLFWAISLTIIGLCFYWFTEPKGCDLELIIISTTLALGVIYTIISITGIAENGCNIYVALLTSSIVNTYCTYLCWDGLTSDVSTHCNSWNNAQDTGIVISCGVLVLFITLGYACFRKTKPQLGDDGIIRTAAEPILAKDEPGEDKVSYNEGEGDGKQLIYFHLFMILGSVYLSMLLTNWGAANVTNDQNQTYDK